MEKSLLRQILAANIERRKEKLGMRQPDLAKKARIAQSHVSRILNGLSAATVDKIAELAEALKCEPWELLVDDEATRREALKRMILGPQPTTDPRAPKKRRKERGAE